MDDEAEAELVSVDEEDGGAWTCPLVTIPPRPATTRADPANVVASLMNFLLLVLANDLKTSGKTLLKGLSAQGACRRTPLQARSPALR